MSDLARAVVCGLALSAIVVGFFAWAAWVTEVVPPFHVEQGKFFYLVDDRTGRRYPFGINAENQDQVLFLNTDGEWERVGHE